MTREDMSMALAVDRHDADNEDVWETTASSHDPLSWALCLCRDDRHHDADHLAWVTTREAAWREHIYYPDDDPKPVHVIRRTVTVELDEVTS